MREEENSTIMVKIKPFAVEQWMDKYEVIATYNIAETCCDSISLADLSTFSTTGSSGGETQKTFNDLFKKTLGYGHIRGSPELRGNVAGLYTLLSPLGKFPTENILITPGAIAANFLLLYTLVGPGDHVICMYPTYQQLYGVPESFGAEVELWRLKEKNNFSLDIEELGKMIRPAKEDGTGGTKLIIINNPNNPTGITLSTEILKKIVDLATSAGNIPILSDEVYRPLFHSLDSLTHPPSIVEIYDHGIATGSMSKAFSLAGLRIGWIAARQHQIIESCAVARDYNTISVSQLDDGMAAYALSPNIVSKILERNVTLCRTNLNILDEFIAQVPKISGRRFKAFYVKPTAGTTAFVKFEGEDGKPVDDKRFCEKLIEKKGVMFLPGGVCFGHSKDFAGYSRIGYACETQVLKSGLKGLGEFLKEDEF